MVSSPDSLVVVLSLSLTTCALFARPPRTMSVELSPIWCEVVPLLSDTALRIGVVHVGDHQPDSGEAPLVERAQERGPEGSVLAVADVDTSTKVVLSGIGDPTTLTALETLIGDWDRPIATNSRSHSLSDIFALHRAAVGRDQWVLVTGASGGVGGALVQLARRRRARVVAVTSASKMELVRELGADTVLDREDEELADTVMSLTGGIDVFADVVGGDRFAPLLETIKRGGLYTTSGAIGGPIVPLDLRTLYLRDLTMHRATVLPSEVFTNMVGYIERGEIRPIVADTFPLERLAEAQTAFMATQHILPVAAPTPVKARPRRREVGARDRRDSPGIPWHLWGTASPWPTPASGSTCWSQAGGPDHDRVRPGWCPRPTQVASGRSQHCTRTGSAPRGLHRRGVRPQVGG